MSKRTGPATRSLEWARALRARHLGVARQGHGGAGMVLPRTIVSRGSWTMLVSHPTQLLFAPRLHFSLGARAVAPLPQTAGTFHPQMVPRLTPAKPALAPTVRTTAISTAHRVVSVQRTADTTVYVPGSVRRVQTGETVESVSRIFENRYRARRLLLTVETTAEQMTRLRRLAHREETTQVEPRLSLRAAPAPAQPTDPPAVQPAQRQARQAEWTSPTHDQAAMPGADALTNHVIQQLDRRLVAYRERMGRI